MTKGQHDWNYKDEMHNMVRDYHMEEFKDWFINNKEQLKANFIEEMKDEFKEYCRKRYESESDSQ